MKRTVVLILIVFAFLGACELDDDVQTSTYYVMYHLEGKATTVNISYRNSYGATVFLSEVSGNQIIDVSNSMHRNFGSPCSIVHLRVENVSNDGNIKARVVINHMSTHYAESDATDGIVDITQYVDPLRCSGSINTILM